MEQTVDRADAASKPWGPAVVTGGLFSAVVCALALLLGEPVWNVIVNPAPAGYSAERMVLLFSTLPRLVMAFLCGAGLAASGAILQQVLRNPLVSPTTLGIDSGARLAIAIATLAVPSLFGIGRDLVALLGSAFVAVIVFAIGGRRGGGPLSLVLAGLVVGLYCGALSTILLLVKDHHLISLFIWGSGSLNQQSWDPALALAWRLALAVTPILVMLRPISLLELGDSQAHAVGLSPKRLRFMAVAVALILAAFVTSAVGIIGFIGLMAPVIARLSGARRFGAVLLWSTLIGGLLLLATDAALQLLAGVTSEFLPTGAVTAVLGSPLLLFLLDRLPRTNRLPSYFRPVARHRHSMLTIALTCGIALVGLAMVALLFGRAADGAWMLLPQKLWSEVMPWRWPRVLGAAVGGALLGLAGLLLQRLTSNEMASPEVLGVSAGSLLALAVPLFFIGEISPVTQSFAATIGAGGVLALILTLSRRSGFLPERILLAGIALNAMVDAIIGVLSATGDPSAVILLGWMAGSTNTASAMASTSAGLAAIVLIACAVAVGRWIELLPLGRSTAGSLGVPVERASLLLLLLAAVMTAVAVPIVGPLTFIGLMAPHIVLAMGIRRAVYSTFAVACVGAAVMIVADWIARTVAFPLQLPTGLVAALAGAPFLIWLLSRRERAGSALPQ